MKLDHTKVAIWAAVIMAISSALLFLSERKEPVHVPPPPVAEVVVPAPPVVTLPPVVLPPVVLPPVTAPVTKARPHHRPAVKKAVKKPDPEPAKCGRCPQVHAKRPPLEVKDRRHTAKCAMVPVEAYEHSTGLVMGAAQSRGLPPDGMRVLKWCIGG